MIDAGSIGTGSVIADGAVVNPPQIIDVANPDFGGLLLDESALEEMPFEASSGRWFWNGGWYLGAESLWMHRSREGRQVIFEDSNLVGPPRRPIQYTTTGQPFNLAPGARITLGKSLGRDYLDRDQSLEMIYYGGMSWTDESGWNAMEGGVIDTPLNLLAQGFNGATRAFSSYSSDFNSMEWNYKLRRRLGRDQLVMSPGGEWTRHAERGFLPALITGIRLANINEDFRLRTGLRAGSTNAKGQELAPLAGDYVINTSNWLLGLNIGGELISQNEFYYWGLRGRAAPCLTFANMNQQGAGYNSNTDYPTRPGLNPNPPPTVIPEAYANTPFSFTNQDSQTAAGFIGDLTLMAGWQIKPNFALQVGYDFLWVGGMASAIKQFNLDQRSSGKINTGGQTFYNGLSFGFNGSW
jgi:hypothetical protein